MAAGDEVDSSPIPMDLAHSQRDVSDRPAIFRAVLAVLLFDDTDTTHNTESCTDGNVVIVVSAKHQVLWTN